MTASTPHPFRILLVEDNPINRKVITLMLARTPYHLETANDGEEAVRKVKSGPVDLVLMDIQLPRKNGYDAAREIRRLDPPRCHVPIIALSAGGAVDDEEELAHEAGMNAFLFKPVRADSLLRLLASWAERIRPAEAV